MGIIFVDFIAFVANSSLKLASSTINKAVRFSSYLGRRFIILPEHTSDLTLSQVLFF